MEINNVSTFAFVGDAVYSVFARAFVSNQFGGKLNDLHKRSNEYVNANFQAQAYDNLKAFFTEEELAIGHRARNVKVSNVPKNSTLESYKKSTSLEAIFGFNFLNNNEVRLKEIFSKIIVVGKGE